MRVFLAGGTGALGAHLVPHLVSHGHDVAGLTRSPEGAAILTRSAARPLTGDLFDTAALQEGCMWAEAVVDCTTVEPRLPRPGGRDWSVNDRLRSEGVSNLVRAALGRSIGRYIHCGLGLVYGDHGDARIGEDAELRTPRLLLPARAGEEAVLAAQQQGLDATVLRMGNLYGPGYAATGQLVGLVRRRLAPLSGNTAAYTSFLHLDDAAAAVALTLEGDRLPPVINVSDDAPARVEEWLPWLARELGAGTPLRLPRWLAALVEDGMEHDLRQISLRMENSLARSTLGFAAQFPSYVEGFRTVIAAHPDR